MNNKSKIAAQELIIAKAQAEIEELKSQQGKRFKPAHGETFYFVNDTGEVECAGSDYTDDAFNYFNCYETEELATKAAVMMKRSNAIIMACLMADPDFVPDYTSGNQEHWSPVYVAPEIGSKGAWKNTLSYTCNEGPSVSTLNKWEEAAASLTEWEIT
jgi:hypothetical protein